MFCYFKISRTILRSHLKVPQAEFCVHTLSGGGLERRAGADPPTSKNGTVFVCPWFLVCQFSTKNLIGQKLWNVSNIKPVFKLCQPAPRTTMTCSQSGTFSCCWTYRQFQLSMSMKKSPSGVFKIMMSNLSRLNVDFFPFYFDIMSNLDNYWERTLIRYSRVLTL